MNRTVWIVFVYADGEWVPVHGFIHEKDAREDASCRLLPTHIARVRVQLPGAPKDKP